MDCLGTSVYLVACQEVEVCVNDIVRGLGIVMGTLVVLAILVAVVTVIGAGVGLVWEFACRVVPLLIVGVLAVGAVVGILWLVGFMARKISGDNLNRSNHERQT